MWECDICGESVPLAYKNAHQAICYADNEYEDGEVTFLDSIPNCPECGNPLSILDLCYFDKLKKEWTGWHCNECKIDWNVKELIDLINR
jgi:hypothetical protein